MTEHSETVRRWAARYGVDLGEFISLAELTAQTSRIGAIVADAVAGKPVSREDITFLLDQAADRAAHKTLAWAARRFVEAIEAPGPDGRGLPLRFADPQARECWETLRSAVRELGQ